MEAQTPPRRDLPLWLGVGVILIGLGLGAWFLYGQVADFVAGKPKPFLIKGIETADYVNMRATPAARAPDGGRRGSRSVNLGDEVRAIGDNAIRIRAGAVMLNVRYAGPSMSVSGSLLNAATLHSDYTITQLLKTRVRNSAPADLGLTDAQLALLQKVQGSPMTYPVHLSDAETSALKPLLDAWRSAPQNTNESQTRAVLTAVRKLVPDKLSAAKASASAEVTAFRSSVSDETWQKIRQAVTSPR